MKHDDSALKIAYLFVTFPKITETFNIREVQELVDQGVRVELFSLLKPDPSNVVHPEAEAFVKKTHYAPWFFSKSVWLSNLNVIIRSPKAYFPPGCSAMYFFIIADILAPASPFRSAKYSKLMGQGLRTWRFPRLACGRWCSPLPPSF